MSVGVGPATDPACCPVLLVACLAVSPVIAGDLARPAAGWLHRPIPPTVVDTPLAFVWRLPLTLGRPLALSFRAKADPRGTEISKKGPSAPAHRAKADPARK